VQGGGVVARRVWRVEVHPVLLDQVAHACRGKHVNQPLQAMKHHASRRRRPAELAALPCPALD